MADFTPIAAGVKPPQQMSLADMVNMASAIQQYQQAQQYNPMLLQKASQEVQKGSIELGQKRQADAERLAVQDLMQNDPDSLMTNGMFDPGKLNKVIPKIAPYTGEQYISKLTTLGKAQNELMESSTKLSQSDKAVIAGPLAVLGRSKVTDPKIYIAELDYLSKQHEGNPNMQRLIKAQRDIISQLPAGEHIAQGAIRASESLLEPSKQIEKFAPQLGTLNTGAAFFPTITQPSIGGSAPSIFVSQEPLKGVQVGPGQRMEATGERDVSNNPIYAVKDVNGNVVGTVVVPSGVPQSWMPGGAAQTAAQPARAPAAQPAAPSNAPVRMPAYETSETMNAARQIQLKANQAATGVQTSQFNNNKIVELADKALVGANAETLSKLGGGYAAVPWTSDATKNRQILGHQMALETANLAAGAGLGTDAARGLAEKMSGTTEWTPEAIKSTARMNRALTTGVDMFNRGVNLAVEKSGNNPFAAREFQNRWSSQEQLIPTMQFIDAMRNAKSDPAGAKAMVDSLGGYGSERYKQMLQRAGKLNDLITKGQ